MRSTPSRAFWASLREMPEMVRTAVSGMALRTLPPTKSTMFLPAGIRKAAS